LLYNLFMDTLDIDKIIQQCKSTLEAYYGEELQGVLLYGSSARREALSYSDIDLLVLLSPPFDFFTELWRIVDLLYPIQLESSRLISAKPASIKDYETGSISLYRNVQAEGVAI
jgi:uncharacterized protein